MYQIMNGGYEDLRVTTFEPNSTADAPQLLQFPTPAATIYAPEVYRFQNVDSLNFLNAGSQMSHGIDVNQQSFIHVHVANTLAMAEGAVIGLFVALNICAIGEVWGTEEIYWCSYTVPAGGIAANTNIMTTDVPLSVALQAKLRHSSQILIKVVRDKNTVVATQNAGDVTDVLNDTIWFFEFDIHFWKLRGGTQRHTPPIV